MNREIKFRAWDIEKEFMFEPTEISLRQNTNFFIEKDWQKLAWREEDSGGIGKIIGKECYLMQFTGLHDKNGVGIYEGDILEMNGRLFNINFKGEYNFGYILISNSDIRNAVMLNVNHLKVISVVGNIYENQELLKQKDGN